MALSCFGPACTTGCLSEVRADGLCHAAAPGKPLKLFFVDMYKVSKLVVKGTGEVSLIKPCFGGKVVKLFKLFFSTFHGVFISQ